MCSVMLVSTGFDTKTEPSKKNGRDCDGIEMDSLENYSDGCDRVMSPFSRNALMYN